jgi:CheY-like chemotaxis protein
MTAEKHVLILDDNEHARTFAATVLTRAGYVVTQAGDSAGAMAALGDQVYSAILLDLQMPHDGVAMIDFISGTMPDLLPRLIILTPGVNRAVWGVLAKPFQAAPLLAAVNDCAHRCE